MPSVSVPAHLVSPVSQSTKAFPTHFACLQCTSRQYSSTLLLRSLSLRVTRRATTRSSVSCPGTCNLPSGTTRSELLHFVLGGLQLTFYSRLNKLLGDVVISQGGVVPFINPEVRCYGFDITDSMLMECLQLLPSKTQKGKKDSQEV